MFLLFSSFKISPVVEKYAMVLLCWHFPGFSFYFQFWNEIRNEDTSEDITDLSLILFLISFYILKLNQSKKPKNRLTWHVWLAGPVLSYVITVELCKAHGWEWMEGARSGQENMYVGREMSSKKSCFWAWSPCYLNEE